jgi:outer membrane lipoprotein-sorting protein
MTRADRLVALPRAALLVDRLVALRAALLVAVLTNACCTHAPPVARPYAAPSAEELASLLAARASSVRSINTRARATSWLGGERVRATVLMLVTRDGHLRFEAEISLQGTVATLATDGRTFALLDNRKNELSRGPACPSNVASLVRIPLAPADVAAIVLGDVRRPPEAIVSPEVAWDASRGADVLELVTPAQTLHIFFARHGAAIDIVGAEAMAGGKRRWQTSYEDFATAAGARLPTTIHFAEGTGSYDDGVEIKLKDRELNGTPPDAAFTLTPPPGVAVKDVGCGG